MLGSEHPSTADPYCRFFSWLPVSAAPVVTIERTLHTGRMNPVARRWIAGLVAALVTAGVLFSVLRWDNAGPEAANRIAGVASLVVAVAALLLTGSPPSSSGAGGAGGRLSQRFRGVAGGNGQVLNAGRDIIGSGNRPPRR